MAAFICLICLLSLYLSTSRGKSGSVLKYRTGRQAGLMFFAIHWRFVLLLFTCHTCGLGALNDACT